MAHRFIAVALICFELFSISALAQRTKSPRPFKILLESIEKYEQASNGHYVIDLVSTSIYVADTTRVTREGYYSFQEKKGRLGYPLIHQVTTESGVWFVRKMRSDSLFYLHPRHEKWQSARLTHKEYREELLTNHGQLPFTHPFYFLGRLPPFQFFIDEESPSMWVVKSGPYKVWISKEDTLVCRVEYNGGKRFGFYKRIDIVKQEFNRPEYDNLDLYRYLPYDSSRFPIRPPMDTLPEKPGSIQLGDQPRFPPFPSTRGDTLSIADFHGQVVLLDFWYIGCKPCVDALPALQQIQDKYRDQGLVVIGLETFQPDPAKITRFLEKREVSYLQFYGPQIREWSYKFGVQGYPTHFLIDREGRVAEVIRGYSPSLMRQSERRIVELLEGE